MTGPDDVKPGVPLSDDPHDDPWEEMEAFQGGGPSISFDLADDEGDVEDEGDDDYEPTLHELLHAMVNDFSLDDLDGSDDSPPDAGLRVLTAFCKRSIEDRRRIAALEMLVLQGNDHLQQARGVPSEKRYLTSDGTLNHNSPLAQLQELVSGIKDRRHPPRMGDRKQFNVQCHPASRERLNRIQKLFKIKTKAQTLEHVIDIAVAAIEVVSGGLIGDDDL